MPKQFAKCHRRHRELDAPRIGRRFADRLRAAGFAAAVLASALLLAFVGPAAAADKIGNCELPGQKGAFTLKPAVAGQLTVEVSLPAPGWWNGDTPETIKDGYEYCMAAEIAYRAGLSKVAVVNVA